MRTDSHLFSMAAILLLAMALFPAAPAGAQGFRISEPDYNQPLDEKTRQLKATKGLDVVGMVMGHIDGIFQPLQGAVVVLSFGKDSLVTTSGGLYGARFFFPKVKQERGRLTVSCLGFETWSKEVTLGREEFHIMLKEKTESLKAAVVQGGKNVIEAVGDTVKYNVAATQRIGEDDMLSDVLARLPGVDIAEDGTVKVRGEEIKRIYVDGKLLFGDSPADALNYLSGTNIKNIKVYDQEHAEDRRSGIRTGRREQVMNVESKEKMERVVIAQGIASYGRNLRRTGIGDNRYGAGVAASLFSEKRQYAANLLYNNMARISNNLMELSRLSNVPTEYKKVGYAGVHASRKWGDAERGNSLSGNYSFAYDDQTHKNSEQRHYLPEEGGWAERTYENLNQSSALTRRHNLGVEWKSRPFIGSAGFSVSQSRSLSEGRMDQAIDGVLSGYTHRIRKHNRDYNGNASATGFHTFRDKHALNIHADWNGGHTTGGRVQRDSSYGASSPVQWRTEPLGDHHDVHAEARYIRRGKNKTLSFGYQGSYEYRMTRELRYENSIDEANLDRLTSADATFHYLSHALLGDFSFWNESRTSGVVTTVFKWASQLEDQRIPQMRHTGKSYFVPEFLAHLHLGPASHRQNFDIDIEPTLPSIEQSGDWFDATNPLFVSRGNVHLKPSWRSDLRYSSSLLLRQGSQLAYDIIGGYSWKQIVQRTTFYPSGGTVDGYTLAPGASCQQFVNENGFWHFVTHIRYSLPLNTIKCNLGANATYRFNRRPGYVDGFYNTSDSHAGSGSIILRSNFSRKHQYHISYTANWHQTDNTRFATVSYLDQKVLLHGKSEFGPFFLSASYTWNLRTPLKGGTARIDANILHAQAGLRLLKDKRGTLSLNVYDLLDDTPGYKTTVRHNYSQTTFRPNFGRYWCLNFTYNFNSSKKKGAVASMARQGMRSLGNRFERPSFFFIR